MNPIPTIVTGVDFSPPSAAALEEAGRLAAWEGARLVIVHVLEEEELATTCRHTGFGPEEVLSGKQTRLDRFCLEALGTRTVPSLELNVLTGHPLGRLLRLAKREGAFLIVVGAQGESHRDSRQPGTLASGCVRHAPCETLLVRAGQTGGFRRVVVTVDLAPGSLAAIRRGAEIARADGGELHVLHVYSPAWKAPALASGGPEVPAARVAGYVGRLERQVAGMARRAAAACGGRLARIAIRENLSRGGGILDYLNEVNADLLVLGGRRLEVMEAGPPGSTTEAMIHDAPCPVLAMPPEEAPWGGLRNR